MRVNPGNIKQFDDKVGEIARAAKDAGIPIRIGVNAGSLDKRLLAKYGKATPEALVESALWEASLFEEHDFRDIKISVKHHDPVVMVQAYGSSRERATTRCTSASPRPARRSRARSSPRSPSARLLAEGIGDTIRVSLSAPPVEEVKVGTADPGVARTCGSAGSRSSRARPAAAPRSTSTRSPSRSPPGSRASRCRCASR